MKNFKSTLAFTIILATVYALITSFLFKGWIQPENSGFNEVPFIAIFMPAIMTGLSFIFFMGVAYVAGVRLWAAQIWKWAVVLGISTLLNFLAYSLYV